MNILIGLCSQTTFMLLLFRKLDKGGGGELHIHVHCRDILGGGGGNMKNTCGCM